MRRASRKVISGPRVGALLAAVAVSVAATAACNMLVGNDDPTLEGNPPPHADGDDGGRGEPAPERDASVGDVSVCPTGYTFASGACSWTGGPRDPELTTGSPPWSLTDGGGVVNPTAEGRYAEKGLFIVSRDAICHASKVKEPILAGLAQTFPMPSPAESEPFELRVVHRVFCSEPGAVCNPTVGLWFSTSLSSAEPALSTALGVWQEASWCLGERAYGPSVSLAIGRLEDPVDPSFCSTPDTAGSRHELQIDSVHIVPSAACPAIGTVANGNFEGASGWTFDGSARIADGLGNEGSRAALLTRQIDCGLAAFPRPRIGFFVPSMWSTLSVPMANPQLTFTYKGPHVRPALIRIGRDQAPEVTITGNGAVQELAMCLPEYARGYAVRLNVEMSDEAPGGIQCGIKDEMVFDDFQVVSNPAACPSLQRIADPGFERRGPLSYWGLHADWSSGDSSADIGSGAAHGGQSSLKLAAHRTCSTASAVTNVTIPPSSGTGGAAIGFWYRIPVSAKDARFEASVATLNHEIHHAIAPTIQRDWTHARFCLPPALADRGARLSFTAASPPACDTEPAPAEAELDIDDVTVTNDAACPK